MHTKQIEELQLRRIANANQREQEQKRAQNGPTIVEAINRLLGQSFDLQATTLRDSFPYTVAISSRLEDDGGLVIANTSKSNAAKLLQCCARELGEPIAAELWFEEKFYMGIFTCTQLGLPKLVDLAHELQDRVHVAPIDAHGVIAVDYFSQAWRPDECDFSVLVQGLALENRLQKCFG